MPAFEKRLTIFDLDTLASVGVIPGVGGNGATVCPKSGHGFTSDHPKPSMFDVKTSALAEMELLQSRLVVSRAVDNLRNVRHLRFMHRRANLEDLFLKLTGREMRE